MSDQNRARRFENLARMIVRHGAIYHRTSPVDGQYRDLGFPPESVRWCWVWSQFAEPECDHCSASAVVCVAGQDGRPDPLGLGVCARCGHVNAWQADDDGWLAPVSLGFLTAQQLVAVVSEVDP